MDRKYKSPFAPADMGTAAPSVGRHGAMEAVGEDGEGCPGLRWHMLRGVPPRHGAHMVYEPTRVVGGFGDPVMGCLAGTGRGNGWWVCSALQMTEDRADHCTLHDHGDEPPGLAWTQRAVGPIQRTGALEQPRPAPVGCTAIVAVLSADIWTPRASLLPYHDRGDGGHASGSSIPCWRRVGRMAPRRGLCGARQPPYIAHQMDVWERDQRCELLQEFQRGETNAHGAICFSR
jgi:hypothetical protein